MPGISGRADELADVALGGERATSACSRAPLADDENSHYVEELRGVIRRCARDRASRDYFVDLEPGLRLESAFTRDSLAYLR